MAESSPDRKHLRRDLKDALVRNLTLDFFNPEEVQAVLRDIDSFDPKLRQKILALCLSLSHASSSLVRNILGRIKEAEQHLSPGDTERWVTHAFDLLDAQGIDPVLRFVSLTDQESLRAFRSPEGLRLLEVAPLLETYLRGLSGREVKVAPAGESYTDTAVVYLPPFLSIFRERDRNFLLYKLLAAHRWAELVLNTLTPGRETLERLMKKPGVLVPDIGTFFSRFFPPDLAVDIYTLLEALRGEVFLRKELPGLMREADSLKAELLERREPRAALSEKSAFVEGLYRFYMTGGEEVTLPGPLRKISGRLTAVSRAEGPRESLETLLDLYATLRDLKGDYEPPGHSVFPGRVRPEAVSRRLRAERDARRKKLEGMVVKLLSMPEAEPRTHPPSETVTCERVPKPEGDYLVIKGKVIELDSELRELVEERGEIPGGVLVKGSDMGAARRCIVLKDDLLEGEGNGEERRGGLRYDEWDFRRGGYKKEWCSLYEYDIHPGHEPFVELTLRRYGGYVAVLRKKFELLKKEPKMLRRQRDGEDIDIDAVVEALSDMHAGLPPGEALFTRFSRQERNIAVLFLIDMSGSTKGWVNEAEKESLVLMCEALDSLGDRYAIYGFSGMTRTRCDYYRIKSFGEEYNETVRKRIAGILPKDYTRMGPPLRHSAKILERVEARTKLLITLSDGKPEDWDAYKGDYGIEDTRKALLEAKEKGIHSFCITIDKEAHSYLPHMYGESHYILIDEVRKLPGRITEIYRKLTT